MHLNSVHFASSFLFVVMHSTDPEWLVKVSVPGLRQDLLSSMSFSAYSGSPLQSFVTDTQV